MVCRMSVIRFLIVGIVFVFSNWITVKGDLSPHIIGGQRGNIKNHPYIVTLRYGTYQYCAGSIYSPYIIITAAHCLKGKDPSFINIYGKSTFLSSQTFLSSIKSAVVHPLYTSRKFDYDVAVIFLTKPLSLVDDMKPIVLSKSRPPVGASVVVVGWGHVQEGLKLKSNQLREASVKIIDSDVCQKQYKEYFTSQMICAGAMDGSKDACQNDSGGPLVYNHQLLGIVSFGWGCGRAGYPGIYASIPDYYLWIHNVTNCSNI